MTSKKESKLAKAFKKAVSPASKENGLPIGLYDERDDLKHFIRKHIWEKRIRVLQRDNNPYLQDGIQYFSFCSKKAFDIRYFLKQNLINQKAKVPFAFVEFIEDDFKFLKDQFLNKANLKSAAGFGGLFSEIAMNTLNQNYGNFWASFPFDVINLDYLGDIFKTTNNSGLIGVNDFFAIENIINKQFALRRSYELWVTVRAKSGRFEHQVKHEFRKIIKNNIDKNEDFLKRFKKEFNDSIDVNGLNDEDLFLIGYVKWLWFVCKKNYSVINTNKSQIIKYKRARDKDGNPYTLYNIFLRIEPYEHIPFSSPVSDAADHCEGEYQKGVSECLNKPIDIDERFKNLAAKDKQQIQLDLKELHKEFKKDEEFYIG